MGNLCAVGLVNGLRHLLNGLGGWHRKRWATVSPGTEGDWAHTGAR